MLKKIAINGYFLIRNIFYEVYQFGAAFGAGLAEHVLAMIGYGVFADDEAVGYLLGAKAQSDKGEDLLFTLREFGCGIIGSRHNFSITT